MKLCEFSYNTVNETMNKKLCEFELS